MTKIVANEMSQKVTNMAMQLLGGYGYVKDYPVERYYRDCRGLGFGGGTPPGFAIGSRGSAFERICRELKVSWGRAI